MARPCRPSSRAAADGAVTASAAPAARASRAPALRFAFGFERNGTARRGPMLQDTTDAKIPRRDGPQATGKPAADPLEGRDSRHVFAAFREDAACPTSQPGSSGRTALDDRPYAKGTNQMSFATSLARLRGSIGIAALVSLAAAAPGMAQTLTQPTQPAQPRPAQPRPAQPAQPRPARAAGSGSAGGRLDGRAGEAGAFASRLDQGLRQGSGPKRRGLLHDARFRLRSGPAGSRRRRLRRQGSAAPEDRPFPDAARLAPAAGRAFRDRPGPADARPLRHLLPERLLRRGPRAQGRRRQPDEEGLDAQCERAEPGHARGHLRRPADRLRQGLRRTADRSEGAGGAAEEAAGRTAEAQRRYAPAPAAGRRGQLRRRRRGKSTLRQDAPGQLALAARIR